MMKTTQTYIDELRWPVKQLYVFTQQHANYKTMFNFHLYSDANEGIHTLNVNVFVVVLYTGTHSMCCS